MGGRYLAFDLGATSGRALRGELDSGRLAVEEVTRFPNGMSMRDGHLRWDVDALHSRIVAGINAAGPVDSIGIDTWGVDFGLLDAGGVLLEQPVTYRDDRTKGAVEEFVAAFGAERLYSLTGIQLKPFNTLIQLYSMMRERSPLLERADRLLFIPDIFNHLLTGVMKTEFTFATTSQLFNPFTGSWEPQLFEALGLDTDLMLEVMEPGTPLGRCRGGGAPVVAVASHDTASAVAAVPARGSGWAFISSGTWSLVGVETAEPLITGESLEHNFTNEGGVCGTFRLLQNVTGLYLLDECARSWSAGAGLAGLLEEAADAPPFACFIDPDYEGFFNPTDVPTVIDEFLEATGQKRPPTRAGIARSVLEALALNYRRVMGQLRELSPKPIEVLHVVGGGARNGMLCRFTADATGLPIVAGPAEATATGNLLVQAMADGRLSTLDEMRAVVRDSFELLHYEPLETDVWDNAYVRFLEMKGR